MKTFQQRLLEAKDAAGFTIKDLSVWFGGIPWQTVSTWLAGREPKPYRLPRVITALKYLENELALVRSRLPVKLGTKEKGRKAYVAAVRARYPDV